MKKLFIIIYLLIIAANTFANQVDDIKTDSDVVKFIGHLHQKTYGYSHPPMVFIHSNEELIKRSGCDSLVKTWGIKNWEKVDFNNDNKTDLLAILSGYYSDDGNCVAIDKGDNTFQLIQIGGNDYGRCQLAKAIKYKGEHMILLRCLAAASLRHIHDKWIPHTDTLIYKYGNFVEYNKTPSHYEIDSISLSLEWGWFGRENTPPKIPVPNSTYIIDHLGNVVLTNYQDFVYYVSKKGEEKPHNPKTTAGVYKTKISQPNLQDIYGLINYLSIKKLNERYAIQVTDKDSNFLRIKFTDGSVKYIADYGGVGTFGLRNLFSKFYVLLDNQKWD